MKKRHPIEILIEQGEHQQLDFKFEVSDSKKIARTLSAFANTDGGRLLIGVKDNGNISGIKSEEEYYMIEAASEMYTQPKVSFEAKRWDIHGKTILEVYIAPGSERPYKAPDKDNKYKAYIRVADENILANDVVMLGWKKKSVPKGRLLRISQPVERLFGYLDEHSMINMNQFCRIANINFHTAKSILSDLLSMEVLKYVVVDKHIYYERGST